MHNKFKYIVHPRCDSMVVVVFHAWDTHQSLIYIKYFRPDVWNPSYVLSYIPGHRYIPGGKAIY